MATWSAELWQGMHTADGIANVVAVFAILLTCLLSYIGDRRLKAAEARANAEAVIVKDRFEAVEHRETKQFELSAKLENELFALNATREHELRTGAVYMALETHSSEIFQFTALNADLMLRFRGEDDPDFDWQGDAAAKERETTLNLYYQSLNLFEVATRMRRGNLFPPGVFASWVPWFIEIIDDWFFRSQWPAIRTNYTDDVRAIFDVGCDIYAQKLRDEAFDYAFYAAVASIMEKGKPAEIGSIAEWPARLKAHTIWSNGQVRKSTSPGTGTPRRALPLPPSQPALLAGIPTI